MDPSLKDDAGHYFEYARSICEGARNVGMRVVVLGHRSWRPVAGRDLVVEPTFRFDLWHRFVKPCRIGFLLDPLFAGWHFYRDLSPALRGRVDSSSVVFAPTVDHRQLLSWAWWLWRMPHTAGPSLTLLLRYTYYDIGQERPWSRDAWWARLGFLALRRVSSGRLRLGTDSAQLAAEYQQLSSMPVEVFPIPHTGDLGRDESGTETALPSQTIRFASLGDAREEKGFALIAEAIGLLAARGEMERLEFDIHAYISSTYHVAMEQPRQALADLELPNVRLITESLSREAYASLIRAADVVLLPYSQRVYHARTSGPFTESLAAGKPVVVTQGTWMSAQLASHGAGTTCRDGDAMDLARAILEVRENFASLSEEARTMRHEWTAFHNPENLVQRLLQHM